MLYDSVELQLQRAMEQLKLQKVKWFQDRDLLNGKSIEQVLELIKMTNSLEEALDSAIYVQENVPEILEIKQSVFKEIEKVILSKGIIFCIFFDLICFSKAMKFQFLQVHPLQFQCRKFQSI
jgi:3-hydroxyacyl-CoA dehydrogenase